MTVGLQKFLDTQKGGSEKHFGLGGGFQKFVYSKTNRGGGTQKNWTASKGAAKISSFEIKISSPTPLII